MIEATSELKAILARHSASAQLGTRRLRYKEGLLQAGERVAAVAFARREPDPHAQGGYREAPTWVVMAASPRLPLLVTDEPVARDNVSAWA